jgi:hypothetical protein
MGVRVLIPGLARLAAAAALLAAVVPAAAAQEAPRAVAFVAGAGFPVDTLKLDQVREIYLGRIEIVGGIRVKPVDQREGQPIRRAVLAGLLRMSRDQYIEHWNLHLFQEGGFTPLLRRTSREVLDTVREIEGAVGYVWLDEAQGQPQVKILHTLTVSPR